VRFNCAHCGCEAERTAGHVNRSRKLGLSLYCSMKCSGLGRRLKNPPTKAEKIAAKAAYDAEYRAKNEAAIKAKKQAYFKATYDPKKAAIERKKTMPRHVEYCRRPEYRKGKSQYDRKYRAVKQFGPFAEAFLMLQYVEAEVSSRATNYEIRYANDTYNKTQRRKRAL